MKSIRKIAAVSILIVINLVWGFSGYTQSQVSNKYGLQVIKDITILKQQTMLDSNKKMLNVRENIPSIILDLRYATTNNFMHEKLYPPVKATFMRKPAVDSLKKVVEYLKEKGYGLKIFDAYRPYSITEKMWEKVKDDRYAADPAKGSGHNRGASIDLTLVDLKTGKEVQMPTGFDNFSDTAHQSFMNLDSAILKNRNVLKTAMEKFRFIALSTEWWHFYLPNSSSYELLDVSFKELGRLNKRSK
ncbi:MAG: M15 family metallopeptidase [Ginsengibacter sp.]